MRKSLGRRPTTQEGGNIQAEPTKDLDLLIAAYFRNYQTRFKEEPWASDEVQRLVRERPAEAWPIVRRLVAEAPDDHARFYVAAGPLEDLVKNYGNELWDEIEREGRQNRRFLETLSGIYLNESYGSVYSRWHELMRRYHLIGPE